MQTVIYTDSVEMVHERKWPVTGVQDRRIWYHQAKRNAQLSHGATKTVTQVPLIGALSRAVVALVLLALSYRCYRCFQH